jgi:hypothetical protein
MGGDPSRTKIGKNPFTRSKLVVQRLASFWLEVDRRFGRMALRRWWHHQGCPVPLCSTLGREENHGHHRSRNERTRLDLALPVRWVTRWPLDSHTTIKIRLWSHSIWAIRLKQTTRIRLQHTPSLGLISVTGCGSNSSDLILSLDQASFSKEPLLFINSTCSPSL